MSLKASVKMNINGTAIYILKVQIDYPDGILVTFSDGTIAGFSSGELLPMRPVRESAEHYRSQTSPPPSRSSLAC